LSATHDRIQHVPSGPAITQRALLDLLAENLGHPVKAQAAGKGMLSFIGLFNPGARELVEMLYEFTAPFVIDGSDMERTFSLTATPMERRIVETLEWLKSR